MSAPTNGFQTNVVASDNVSELSRMTLVMRKMLGGLRTNQLVRVTAVSNDGGVAEIGFVSVQPLVSLVDGQGGVWPHGIIPNVPYMRVQGGSNAIILDPQVGDIGLACVSDRDISTVKSSKTVSAPGSTRKHDMSDFVYLMTVISASGAPTQYVQFNADGITITSPVEVKINAPTVTVNSTDTVINTTNATVNSTDSKIQTVTAEINATTSAAVTSPIINLGNGGTIRKLVNDLFMGLFNAHTHKSNGTGVQTDATPTPISATQLTSVVKAG